MRRPRTATPHGAERQHVRGRRLLGEQDLAPEVEVLVGLVRQLAPHRVAHLGQIELQAGHMDVGLQAGHMDVGLQAGHVGLQVRPRAAAHQQRDGDRPLDLGGRGVEGELRLRDVRVGVKVRRIRVRVRVSGEG